jgi:hypothetical protein
LNILFFCDLKLRILQLTTFWALFFKFLGDFFNFWVLQALLVKRLMKKVVVKLLALEATFYDAAGGDSNIQNNKGYPAWIKLCHAITNNVLVCLFLVAKNTLAERRVKKNNKPRIFLTL